MLKNSFKRKQEKRSSIRAKIIAGQLWLQAGVKLEVWQKNTRNLPIDEEAPKFAYGAILVN